MDKQNDKIYEEIKDDMISLTAKLVKHGDPYAHATFCTMIQTYCERSGLDSRDYAMGLVFGIMEVAGYEDSV